MEDFAKLSKDLANDLSSVTAQRDARESELNSAKEVLEKVNAERMALDQTCLELMRSNIQLKTLLNLSDNKVNKLTNDISSKECELSQLKKGE